MHRGVTLLELLIVLTLMGVTATLVVPLFTQRTPRQEEASVALVTSARRTAVRRSEPLRIRLSPSGAWSVHAIRTGAIVDSGRVDDALPDTDLLIGALGGCMPARTAVRFAAFDPMTCAYDPPATTR